VTDLTTAAVKAVVWTTRRNNLIRLARAEGSSLRAIGRATGLSHTAIARILARDDGNRLVGKPVDTTHESPIPSNRPDRESAGRVGSGTPAA
jgi:hypothetical protein